MASGPPSIVVSDVHQSLALKIPSFAGCNPQSLLSYSLQQAEHKSRIRELQITGSLNRLKRRVFAMIHLDYVSCLLTVLATILLARKSWIGLLVAIVNSLIVCIIGFRTSQLGFIPANLFCICVYASSMRPWLKEQPRTNRDQAQRQESLVTPTPSAPQKELLSPPTQSTINPEVNICNKIGLPEEHYAC